MASKAMGAILRSGPLINPRTHVPSWGKRNPALLSRAALIDSFRSANGCGLHRGREHTISAHPSSPPCGQPRRDALSFRRAAEGWGLRVGDRPVRILSFRRAAEESRRKDLRDGLSPSRAPHVPRLQRGSLPDLPRPPRHRFGHPPRPFPSLEASGMTTRHNTTLRLAPDVTPVPACAVPGIFGVLFAARHRPIRRSRFMSRSPAPLAISDRVKQRLKKNPYT